MLGIDWIHFNQEEFEYYDQLNFLKTGLATADMVTTVSPRYSHEIRTPEQGCGLDGVLQAASDHVIGITNGIDTEVWNPSTDKHLDHNFDAGNWQQGKKDNKRSLQEAFGLEVSEDVPLIGLVGRLAGQKGWDLILPVLRMHLTENRPTQWIVLGSGEARFETALRSLAAEFPGHFALHIGFSDALAHRIEASSDVFLMPSHYEPCGLNQLYSLRYGTLPIVTPTGGLADTVVNATDENFEKGTATGFFLANSTPAALDDAINRALRIRFHEPDRWAVMVGAAMAQDWSWTKSAAEYISAYERCLALKGI